MNSYPEVTITYFVPDKKKKGGAYVTVAGIAKRLNDVERVLILLDGTIIPIGDIAGVDFMAQGYI